MQCPVPLSAGSGKSCAAEVAAGEVRVRILNHANQNVGRQRVRVHGPTGVCNCVLRQSGAGGEDRQLRVRETRNLGMRECKDNGSVAIWIRR